MISSRTIMLNHVGAFRRLFQEPGRLGTVQALRERLDRYWGDLDSIPVGYDRVDDQRKHLTDLSSLLGMAHETSYTMDQILLGSQRALQLSTLFPRDEERDDDFLARYAGFITGQTPLSRTNNLDPGSRIEIAKGKFGTIFKVVCRNEDEERPCAMKYFSEPKNYLGAALSGFFLELCFQGIPNVRGAVEVLDFGLSEGKPYLLMELMDKSLPELAEVSETFTDEEIVGAAVLIVGALAAAHARGIVHRDIKPGNILFSPSGDCKMTDFGFASTPAELETLPQNAHFCGTPGFIPPEAYYLDYEGGNGLIDERKRNEEYRANFTGDIYAMGSVLLWFSARGKLKESRMDLEAPRFLRASDDESFQHVPKPLRPVLQKAVSRHPHQRHAKGIDMLKATLESGESREG